jgi:hypothetical protein
MTAAALLSMAELADAAPILALFAILIIVAAVAEALKWLLGDDD